MRPPWELVGYLAWEFDLNTCETADLAQWADSLAMWGAEVVPGFAEENLRAHLEARAEMLATAGSPFQEGYDEMARHAVDGPYVKWDENGPTFA